MTKLIALVVAGSLSLVPAEARPEDEEVGGWSDLGVVPDWDGSPAAPAEPPPADPPPVPEYTYQVSPPQAPAVAQPAPASAPAGQWVYTQQYGWIWMPYGDAYTYAPAGGYGAPYAYVYTPAHSCWTWVAAPWVWGIGPWPFFGAIGPVRFAWYGHGWWRTPHRWHYAPHYRGYAAYRPALFPAPGFRGGAWGGVRTAPAPVRAGGRSYRGVAPAPHRGAAPPSFRGGGWGSHRGHASPAPGGWGNGGGRRGGGSRGHAEHGGRGHGRG